MEIYHYDVPVTPIYLGRIGAMKKPSLQSVSIGAMFVVMSAVQAPSMKVLGRISERSRLVWDMVSSLSAYIDSWTFPLGWRLTAKMVCAEKG